MKKIKLTQGEFALVDDEDFEELNKYKWFAHWDVRMKGFYAHRSIRNNGKKDVIIMHRIILGLKKGDGLHGDHINHNTLDNRRKNLRICTPSENGMNKSISKLNTSGFKGVSWCSERKKWTARIGINCKSITLGRFETKEEAYRAYCRACVKYHGEHANFG